MISPKENYLNSFYHKKLEYVPCTMTDGAIIGFGSVNGPWIEKGPEGGGYDGFGVLWVCPESGNNAAIPAPGKFLIDDIADWKKIQIPDLAKFDFEEDAKKSLEGIDRSQRMVEFGVGNGIFERLAAVMGFENALVSLAEDPEACCDFFEAVTQYKIDFIEQIHKYYKPDIINYYDDIATELGLFMSPAAYRELLKPYHEKTYKAIHEMGMFVAQHTCGKAEALVEDMIEIGVDQWISVQPTNDICGLIEKYGDKITFAGGFDSNGEVSREEASDDEIRAEVRRCVDMYGKYQKAYAMFGFLLDRDIVNKRRKMGVLFQEFNSYRMKNL